MDLIKLAKKRNGQKKLYEEFRIGFVRKLDRRTVLKLLKINFLYGSFVIKTHSNPTRLIYWLSLFGIIRTTFSYRHPVDTVLSAIDHRNKTKDSDRPVFVQHKDLESSSMVIKKAYRKFGNWSTVPNVLFVKYEVFTKKTAEELFRIQMHLRLNLSSNQIESVVSHYHSNPEQIWNLNKGNENRYKSELEETRQKELELFFENEIEFAGYNDHIT